VARSVSSATEHGAAVRGLLSFCVALWLGSLLLPAVEVQSGPIFTGLDVLRRGWSAGSSAVFAWYANPLFAAAIVFQWWASRRAALAFAALAFLLGLSSLWAAEQAGLVGISVPPFSFRAGYYVWLVALGVALIVSVVEFRHSRTGQSG
jgi:hypothetical protein